MEISDILREYIYEEPFLSLTFPRSIESVKKVSQQEGVSNLSDEEVKGYEWINSQEEVSTKEYAQQFGYTQRTASRHLGNMLKLDLIKSNRESQKSPKLRYSIKST
jgi:ATP-dependent DNA helicase RecG